MRLNLDFQSTCSPSRRFNEEKRLKKLQKKQELVESRKQLQDVRVVQKNLVYVAGLPQRIADEVRSRVCGHDLV